MRPDLKWRLPPELRTMSVVPRWSIVWTLTRDSIANHSFFVTFYAREIAILIGWEGDLSELMFRALVHDAEESVTGDIVSPVKAEIIDDQRAGAYIQAQLRERMPFIVSDLDVIDGADEIEADEAWAIVKAADRLDALIFLLTERRLGNGVIAPHLPMAINKAEAAWHNLPADRDRLNELWNTVMMPAINAHETIGGAGLAS